MLRTLSIAASALVFSSALHAQAAAPFLGRWTAAWEGEAQRYEAVMTVTESGGTWKTATQSKNNPCVGREVPLKHEASTPQQLDLTLQFSEVITGCRDAKVVLNAGANGEVTGKRGKYELTLKKAD